MPNPVVKPFPEKSQELADALATQILKYQDEAIEDHNEFIVAVSGGSLVSVLEKALVGQKNINWSKWRIFFADERVVPLDDKDSNYGLLKNSLLEKIPTNTTSGVPIVYAIDPSIYPSAAVAESYQITLKNSIKRTTSVYDPNSHAALAVPKFDLILLGCGGDGHTCSLFPGHKLNYVYDKVVASIDDSPKPPPSRVTITNPVLRGAANIIFVAEGAGKKEALDGILVKKDQKLPSAVVNEIAQKPVTWYVSESAVEGLELNHEVAIKI